MTATANADELLTRGIKLLEAGHYRDAARNLRASYQGNPSSPVCRSYLGLALALGEKKYGEAEELCKSAIKHEFYQSDFYHNLGKVYIASRQRGLAIKAFRKGLEVDPSNDKIRQTLERIGVRTRPIFPFLSRDHFLNRELGKLRARLTGRRGEKT
jgi:tetratricopeptide (TPR) repeat protein